MTHVIGEDTTDAITDTAQETFFRVAHKKPSRQHIVRVDAAPGLEQHDVAISVHDCVSRSIGPSGAQTVHINVDPNVDGEFSCVALWTLPTDFTDLASLKDSITCWSCDTQLEYQSQSVCQMLPGDADRELANTLVVEMLDAQAFPDKESYFTLTNTSGSGQAKLDCLTQLQHAGIVAQRCSLQGMSTWSFTDQGFSSLRATTMLRNPRSALALRDVPVESANVFELMCLLADNGWSYSILAPRTLAKTIEPYKIGGPRKWYIREGCSTAARTYLWALCVADDSLGENGTLGHLQKESYYEKFIDGDLLSACPALKDQANPAVAAIAWGATAGLEQFEAVPVKRKSTKQARRKAKAAPRKLRGKRVVRRKRNGPLHPRAEPVPPLALPDLEPSCHALPLPPPESELPHARQALSSIVTIHSGDDPASLQPLSGHAHPLPPPVLPPTEPAHDDDLAPKGRAPKRKKAQRGEEYSARAKVKAKPKKEKQQAKTIKESKKVKHEQSFEWPDPQVGPFVFTFRPPRGKSGAAGYQVTCLPGLHAAHGAKTLCRKCCSFNDEEEEDEVIRALKLWCLACDDASTRLDHKDTNPRDLLLAQPCDVDLDSQAAELVPRLEAQVRGDVHLDSQASDLAQPFEAQVHGESPPQLHVESFAPHDAHYYYYCVFVRCAMSPPIVKLKCVVLSSLIVYYLMSFCFGCLHAEG